MKIQKTEPTKTFQPITITITIESEEELKSIKKMAGYNATISSYFSDSDSETVKIINKFLTELYRVI
jgi:hypothetical protein